MDMRNYSDKDLVKRDKVRDIAKRATKVRMGDIKTGKGGYIEGRLGMIIDGTGKNYDRIQGQMRDLQKLGYENHMIFVNTSIDVALQRNEERPRKLPEAIVTSSWKDVQKNIGKFQNLFRQNFIIIDNNDPNKPPHIEVYKRVKQLANKKVTNGIAKAWIAKELELKKRT